MAKSEPFKGYKILPSRLAKKITEYLEDEEFETNYSKNTEGTTKEYLIQARKGGKLRTVVGARRSTNILIEGKEGNFTITIGTGEWKKNLATTAPLFIPFLLPVGIAVTLTKVYAAKRFENNIWKKIKEIIFQSEKSEKILGLLPWVSGNRGIGKFLKLGWFIYTDNSIGLLDGYIPSGKLIEKEDGLLKSIAKEIAFLPVNVEHIVEDYTIDDFRTDIIHGNNFLIPYGNITSIYEEDKGNYNLLLVNYNDKNKERVIRFGKVLSTQDMGGGPIPKSFAAMDWKPVIKAVKKFEKSIKE